jgi:hypothetical protein
MADECVACVRAEKEPKTHTDDFHHAELLRVNGRCAQLGFDLESAQSLNEESHILIAHLKSRLLAAEGALERIADPALDIDVEAEARAALQSLSAPKESSEEGHRSAPPSRGEESVTQCPACGHNNPPEGLAQIAIAERHHIAINAMLDENERLTKELVGVNKRLEEKEGWGGLMRGGH